MNRRITIYVGCLTCTRYLAADVIQRDLEITW